MTDYFSQKLRTSTEVLSTSYEYVELDHPDLKGANQLLVYLAITKGSLTTIEAVVEFSPDGGTTWYRETAGSVSSGTETNDTIEHQFDATGNYRLAIPLLDSKVRIGIKGTGTTTGSQVQITTAVGNT